MAKELPHPPASFLNPDRFAKLALVVVKRKMQSLVGSSFKEVRDEVRKEFGLTEQEANEMILYTLKLSRIACNEIFDDLQERYSKEK